jgi:hypothetical protein
MRGLPSCGKSYTARVLAQAGGIVLETDEFFYTQVGDDPTKFDWSDDLLPQARQWNLDCFRKAMLHRISPIIIDRGNGRNRETWEYARLALTNGYCVELKEPDSPQWRAVRELLADKVANQAALDDWADRLAEMSRATHRVPTTTIKRWMAAWQLDLTVAQILSLGKLSTNFPGSTR